jgi:hypothetical protein
MSKELDRLIELARQYAMTPAEQEQQVRSFAFGNTHFENQTITKQDIDEAMDSLRAEREFPIRT